MFNGALYKRANELQRRDAKQVLEDFSHQLHFRADGHDSLLDIGCGSGDVTIDYILPLLPRTFSRLVGSDISDGMLRTARDSFHHSKVTFEKLDISASLDTQQLAEPFDHITSFYCLHWVQDQQRALQNIYDLLRPNGDCLLAYLAANPIFEIYQRLSENPRWAPFMTDAACFISPFQHSTNPAAEIEQIMCEAGFTDYRVQLLDKVFIYDGVDILHKSLRAVNPFVSRLDEEDQGDFLDEYVKELYKMGLVVPSTDGKHDDSKFINPYKLIVAYGHK